MRFIPAPPVADLLNREIAKCEGGKAELAEQVALALGENADTWQRKMYLIVTGQQARVSEALVDRLLVALDRPDLWRCEFEELAA